jgi:RNA polymerase sigma-70 factor (ECF subfamily)
MSVPVDSAFAQATDPHRRELLAHCYRMLGSYHDAEDAVQETYLRAWRAFDQFEGRSSIRTWLYRIATRVCLTAAEARGRRVLPSGLGAPLADGTAPLEDHRPETPWLEPIPDSAMDDGDPAAVVVRRESTRLAFIAALQQLPARQRAALLLRDVAAMSANEVADLLELSTAAVNSALQRARAHIEAGQGREEVVMTADVDSELLQRYIAAFEAGDVAAFAALLRHDVELEMPPIPTWFSGRDAVVGFYATRAMNGPARRVVATRANGCPAVASYLPDGSGGFVAHNIQVLEVCDGAVKHIYAFLDLALFAAFNLPLALPVVS